MDILPPFLYVAGLKEDYDSLGWIHGLHDRKISWIILDMNETEFYELHPESHFQAFLHDRADQLRAISESMQMLFSVCDSSVALFSGADGVHLSHPDQNTLDRNATEIRQSDPGLLLGVTVSDIKMLLSVDTKQVNYILLETPPEDLNERLKAAEVVVPVYVLLEPGIWRLICD